MKNKKSTKILMTLIISLSTFFYTSIAKAATATVGFDGNSTVSVGSNITIKMYVTGGSNIDGGIVSVGGNLTFDSNYLEYVSATGIQTPYAFQINTNANYIIAGLDTTLSNGITSKTQVLTITFKAKKKGTTQVSLTNAKLSDVSSKLSTTVVPKTITINDSSTIVDPGNTKSSDATLKSLSASGYTLSPSFNPNTTSYTIKVPNDASTVKLDGSVNNSNAKVSGLGNISLTGNTTTATIKVTAEDGTVKTYTVKIEKESKSTVEKSSDATLKKLDVSGYTLTPTFSKNVTTYSMKVKNNITALNVTAIANDKNATVSISGNKNWKEGNNTITIRVTAEDGSVNTYIVNVEREVSSSSTVVATKSSDNYLKKLIINSPYESDQEFDKNINNYNITVPNEVEKLDIKAILNNTKSKVEITGNEDFKVGKVNVVEIKVTAEDGSVRIYSLNVTRSTVTSETDLKDIEIDGASINPKFDSNTLEYTTNVDSKTNKIDIKATPSNSDSKVEIIGNENLKEGHNTVLIKVTDKEGFVKYYTIDVVKEASKTATSNSTLFGLTPLQFGFMLGLLSLILLLIILIIVLSRKKKEQESKIAPVIEVKPEFNFGSKNSDDDVIHGDYNQNSDIDNKDTTPKSIPEPKINVYDADYEDNLPYDPYDEIVTKREVIDAIHEAMKTKDPSKLKMLLQQDALNQAKKELKQKEEMNQNNELNSEETKEQIDDEWR